MLLPRAAYSICSWAPRWLPGGISSWAAQPNWTSPESTPEPVRRAAFPRSPPVKVTADGSVGMDIALVIHPPLVAGHRARQQELPGQRKPDGESKRRDPGALLVEAFARQSSPEAFDAVGGDEPCVAAVLASRDERPERAVQFHVDVYVGKLAT